ncbi:hypothetical protein AB0C27_05065, partial [Nonomuraea sp. NPDC048882]|uniref:hypothetical protein n=1 Tax=Nonomuraea sp. NPDC048882 TaxID=3154347 RepID=UPI0033F4344C
MTLSTPLLAAAPLLAGLIGPALIGAAPARQQNRLQPDQHPVAGGHHRRDHGRGHVRHHRRRHR